jgi:hypothetical protein
MQDVRAEVWIRTGAGSSTTFICSAKSSGRLPEISPVTNLRNSTILSFLYQVYGWFVTHRWRIRDDVIKVPLAIEDSSTTPLRRTQQKS